MGADIRNVRLIRKNIKDQAEVIQREEDENKETLFATDYFDVMKVEKKRLTDTFTSIMGIWPEESIGVDDIAVQSYSLYCSEKMLEYEKNIKKTGDPFRELDDGKSMSYLSMIQIHITPEILAHVLTEMSEEEFMNCIYEDIHSILGAYTALDESLPMIYRIYKMISTGDFSLVIRSTDAKISFEISTLLRQRAVKCNKEKGIKSLVLYKTYTLLTLAESVITQDGEGEKFSPIEFKNVGGKSVSDIKAADMGNRYVIRCCYSNLYWSEKNKVEEFLKKKKSLSGYEIFGLNGRYDFSVYIQEKEFLELFRYIKEYKESRGKDQNGCIGEFDPDQTGGTLSIVDYLKYLMKNRYLSCINERYLLASNNRIPKIEDINQIKPTKVKLSGKAVSKREEFLDYKIQECGEKIKEKYKKIRELINAIQAYRKNMKHYMNLLNKLIVLCQGINGLSDTRIYALVLLEQLDVILDSVSIYIRLFGGKDMKGIHLDLLEDYIRESVCALDGYAQYIRNNNLQSLQTPNYNIESNTSMEKVLIGYSEFLNVFIEYYQKSAFSKMGEGSSIEHQYLPIVVPALSKREVAVEIMFREGVCYDWDWEKQIREQMITERTADLDNIFENGKDRYCMVICIPTLTELGNIVTMVPSLFHEVAHQFRYESRKDRNDALLRHSIHVSMRMLARGLTGRLQSDIGCYDWTKVFEKTLEKYLITAYLDAFYQNSIGEISYVFREAPLKIFSAHLENDMKENLKYWGKKDELKLIIQEFLRGMSYYYCAENRLIKKSFSVISEILRKIQDETGERMNEFEFGRQMERMIRCAYCIAWESSRQHSYVKIRELCKIENFEEWLEIGNIEYEEEWSAQFAKMTAYEKSDSYKIWEIFQRFYCWIYDELTSGLAGNIFDGSERAGFIKLAYKKACEGWYEELTEKRVRFGFDSNMEAMGRALGIDDDNENNFRIFKNILENEIDKYRDDMIRKMKEMIDLYREETADIFMCNAMGLEAFGYMYVLAVNWPDDRSLNNIQMKRCLDVILYQWCLKENENDKSGPDYEKFRNLAENVMDKLKESVKVFLENLNEDDLENLNKDPGSLKEHFEGLKAHIDPMSFHWEKDMENLETVLANIQYLDDVCQDLRKYFKERKYRPLKFYKIMCEMMYQYAVHVAEHIEYLREYDEVSRDFVHGVENLRTLNQSMCENKENREVKMLGEFSNKIAGFINEPCLNEIVKETQKYADMNRESIEFLTNMYYLNKRRTAQKLEDK